MANIEILGEYNFPKEKITHEILELIHRRLEFISSEKQKMEGDLKKFHDLYQKSNDDFLHDFQNGKLGDQEDFFIWKASLKLLKDIIEEEKMLKELL